MIAYRQYDKGDDAPLIDGDEQFIGLNARLAPDKLGPGFASYAENVRFRTGQATTRLGLAKPAWLNVTLGGSSLVAAVGKWQGAGKFLDPASVEWTLLAADERCWAATPNNQRFPVSLPAAVSLSTPVTFVQAFGQVYCFRGRYLQPLVCDSIDTGFADLLPRWSATPTYNAAVIALSQGADEIAYGPFVAISVLTCDSTLITVVTTAPHGYVSGADVTVQGASGNFNGRYGPITVVDDKTFTYSGVVSAHSPAVTPGFVSNMANYWSALGSQVTLSSLTQTGGTATATAAAHGFSNGQTVTIAGVATAGWNGSYVISGVAANTFQFASTASSPASGTKMTAQTSLVLAGQSPDTNPEAWRQIFDILPNADDALYVSNLLLVPTAFTPSDAAGTGTNNAYGSYDSTSYYGKKDFIVISNYQDPIHFQFVNELRVNQGTDDEIVQLVKYNNSTVVVLKGRSWGLISNISGDLSGLTLDMRGDVYGCCAPRGAAIAGQDVLFASARRGISSLYMEQLGLVRGTDTPFSNEFEAVIQRINWGYANQIRLAWWNDYLFCAVPLDDAAVKLPLPFEYSYGFAPPQLESIVCFGMTVGRQYYWDPGANGAAYVFTQQRQPGAIGAPLILTRAGYFTAVNTTANVTHATTVTGVTPPVPPYTGQLSALQYGNNAILVYDYRMGYQGSILSYDFRAGQWAGVDRGVSHCVQEFISLTINGKDRLAFIGRDGFVSLVDESFDGDQVGNPNQSESNASGLTMAPIQTLIQTRGYKLPMGQGKEVPGRPRGKNLEVAFDSFNATVTLAANTGAAGLNPVMLPANQGGANDSRLYLATVTFSRTAYRKPFNAAPFDGVNDNNDFQAAGRDDYSFPIPPGGFYLGTGMCLGLFQEFIKRVTARRLAGQYLQFTLRSSTGRISLKCVAPEAAQGASRNGTMI